MTARKVLGLGLPLLIFTIVLGSSIGAVGAIYVTQLPPIKLSIFQQNYADSEFTVVVLRTNLRRTNTEIDIRLTNGGTSTHSANVTVSCYGDSDNLLQETFQLTGSVAAGQYVDRTYTFDAVNRNNFSYSEIAVQDLT